jgi:hypothetical protein
MCEASPASDQTGHNFEMSNMGQSSATTTSRLVTHHGFYEQASAGRLRVNDLEQPTSWKQPFLQALEESDRLKLTELVRASERAIFLRQQELNNSSDHHDERSEMSVAEVALQTIKTHKLGCLS